MKRIFVAPAVAAGFFSMFLSGCTIPGASNPETPEPQYRDVLFVADRANNVVDVIDTSSGQVITKVPVGSQPSAIAASDVGLYVYVVNSGSHNVSVIDAQNFTVKTTITAGTDPVAVAEQDRGNNIVAIFSAADKKMTLLDGNKQTVLSTVSLSFTPSAALIRDDQVAIVDSADKKIYIYDLLNSAFEHTFNTTATPVSIADDGCSIVIGESGGDIDGLTMNVASRNYCGATGGMTNYTSTFTLHVGGPASAIGWSRAGEVTDAASNSLYFTQGAPHYGKTLVSTPVHYTGSAVAIVDGPLSSQKDAHQYGYLLTASPSEIKVADQTTSTISGTWALPAGSQPSAMTAVYEAPSIAVTPAPPASTPTPAPTATPTPVPTATPTPVASSSLYVANGFANTLEAYAAPVTGSSVPTAVTMPGITSGIAYDGNGTLAVQANSNVYLYNSHLTSGSTPFATLSTSLSGQIAFDGSGNLFVPTDFNSVLEFKKPFSNTETPQLLYVSDHSAGVAFDASGNMYVANFSSGNLGIVAPPYANNSQTTLVPAPGATLSSVAVRGGTLYVADTGNNAIYAFALPVTATSAPAHTYAATDPEVIAFDASGNLYVSNDTNNRVDVYAPPSGSALTLNYSLSGNGLSSPFGLAIAP